MSDKIMPRAHQIEALEALRDGLARASRTQAHMCCGSGKTFTQAFLARHVLESSDDPGLAIIVCFVPNRALIHQNARNFRLVFSDTVEYIGVCSDADLSGLVKEEDLDEGLETTTDRARIVKFLARRRKPRIVFSTYQSAVTLRDAVVEARGDEFITLGLFDEAHRTAGDKSVEDLFAFGLDDKNFLMSKRGFFTATPRIIEGKKASGISMSDPALYGAVAYEYPFSRGIKDGNVVDYDLWVPIITRRELAEFMRDRNLEGEERSAVALIALEKVMERTGQSRFLAYRNRISASKEFTKELVKVFEGTGTTVAHVDGSTSGPDRDKMMAALSKGRTILSNCKAFVEGVDAPGLQGVLFVDPRKSVVDVVQAVGRLSRPDPADPGKRGSIIAPILTESADPAALARAANVSGFQTLVQVAQALRANDDALEEDILERSRAVARGDSDIKPLHNMEVIAPEESSVDISVLAQAITVATMEDLKDGFAEMVGRLEKFINKTYTLPTKATEPRLHAWMAAQRKKHMEGTLEPVHAALLDEVEGWSWIGERTPPEKIVRHIAAFRDREQRMPSRLAKSTAEADLNAYLMEGQENYLRFGLRKDPRLTQALLDENLLFFGQEVLGKRAHLSGRFSFYDEDGKIQVVFTPRLDKNRKTVPVFQSGHTMTPRPVRIHVGRLERERLMALEDNHSVRVTLTRAGIDKEPLLDGRILEWHAGTVYRGEGPETSKESFAWLLARLKDRKVSGRPAYSRVNLANKEIKENKEATLLNPRAPSGTVGEVLGLIERVRQGFFEGKIVGDRAAAFDEAPGFSWLEEDSGKNLAFVMKALIGVYGQRVYTREARLGDKGVSNTLRVVDGLIERGGHEVEEELSKVDNEVVSAWYDFLKNQNEKLAS